MKIDKVIVSCDNSHYQYYWPIVAKVCKKIIKATPVLFLIDNEDSDFYFDGNGLVKKVKSLPELNTGIQSLFYRMYGAKLFPDEVCLISDIDMMLLSYDYFQGTIKDFDENSFVVYSSDAYSSEREGSKNIFSTDMFAMCYVAAKGKIFEDVLDLHGDFSDFVERLQNYNLEKGVEWFGDEVYLTNRVNLFSEKYNIHKLVRGYQEGFKVKDRIEKWQFPVEFTIPEMKQQSIEDGCYSEKLLSEGYYKDCHCVRPYGWYEDDIHKVANIAGKNDKLFQTIEGQDYTTVDDRCLFDDGCIVDIGCLHWDWSNFFIGKKRVVGVDPFENSVEHTEIFKGVLGSYDGFTNMENRGIESTTMGNQNGDTVEVKTWKTFINEYNINKISVLKLNIEGAEYELLNTFTDEDFDKIDQIAVSFHDWMVSEWKGNTEQCIELLESKNFTVTKINESWGWYLAIKNLETKDYRLFDYEKRSLMYHLGDKYKTDKILHHRFDRVYNRFLEPLRNSKIKLFEIGCGKEHASFNMWKDYFPIGEIFSMDIDEELVTERGTVYRGDQTNKDDLDVMIKTIGKCDVIIDDGSHIPRHQIDTFDYLFDRMLKNGGIYIIEDIECGYWDPKNTIYGYEIGNENIIDYFQGMQHRINSEFSGLKNHRLISSVTYFKNCIILTKMTSQEIEENKKEYRFKEML
jgi:FkbM family methyltransferase